MYMYNTIYWSVLAANQETVVELVSFFQRSIPEELLSHRSAASVTPSSSQENDSTDHLDKTQVNTH